MLVAYMVAQADGNSDKCDCLQNIKRFQSVFLFKDFYIRMLFFGTFQLISKDFCCYCLSKQCGNLEQIPW